MKRKEYWAMRLRYLLGVADQFSIRQLWDEFTFQQREVKIQKRNLNLRLAYLEHRLEDLQKTINNLVLASAQMAIMHDDKCHGEKCVDRPSRKG